MPGAIGASGSTAPAGTSSSSRPSTRSISLARQAAGPQQQRAGRGRRRWWIRRRPAPARRRRSDRCGRRDRPARAGRWWARRGRSGWRRARPPAGRAGCRMPRATGWLGTRTAMLSRPAVASSATGQAARLRSTSVSGPGQNAVGKALGRGIEHRQPPGGGEIEDMGDQRIERRPALGGIEPRDRGAVGGVGAEAIDGLGRERDQAAVRRGSARRRRCVATSAGTTRVAIVSVIVSSPAAARCVDSRSCAVVPCRIAWPPPRP